VRGVLDTSVFIAGEEGRPLASERLPDEVAISVVTLAELELGVHLAGSEDARARRLATLRAVSATYVALPIDDRVASAFAELVATTRRAGRRLKVQDAWIAATARVHSAAIFTQDGDFDRLPGVEAVRV
jgi:predicted nucleic acid-binding protein